jgi:hypothetical protein
MRTTLDIDEDVLIAAKELARIERSTAGHVISRLARERLSPGKPSSNTGFIIKDGLPVFPSRGDIITNDLINRIREEEGI